MKMKLSLVTLLVVSTLQATSLSEAVKKGINYDPEVLAETKKYEVKDKSVALAESGYLPKVDLYGGIGYEETDRENLHSAQKNENFTRREASARLRQPIFEGYDTTYAVSAAGFDKEASGYGLEALKGNKALKIIQAYLNVLQMQKIATLAKDNLHTHKKIQSSISQRHTQGVSTKADLIQIKGRVQSAATNLFSSMNNVLDAKATYLSLVGEMPTNLQSVSSHQVKIPSSLQSAISQSVTDHPTMLASQKNVSTAESHRDGSESGYYPHLYADLSANHEVDAGGIEGPQDTYQAMVRVEWNIFNGFKEEKQHEISQIEVLRAGDQSSDTKRQLELETRLSWNAYSAIRQQLKPLKNHVGYAKEATKLYEEQYTVNRRSLIDVLNSQVEYFNANRALVKARYDEIAAKYRILNSIGTLNQTLRVK